MIIEAILEGAIGEVFVMLIRRLGASIRWLFLGRKYTFKELLSQDWNLRSGFFVLLSALILGLAI